MNLIAFALARTVLGIVSALLLMSIAPLLAGWSSEVVVSGSMMPRIAPGDVVVTQPSTASAVTVGQVVLVSNPAQPGTLLMHRVIGRDPDGSLRTRGDANVNDDSTPVPASMVRGLPRVCIPYIGLPTLWLRHGQYVPVGTVCLVLMGAVLISRSQVKAAVPTQAEPAGHQPDTGTPGDTPPEDAELVMAMQSPLESR